MSNEIAIIIEKLEKEIKEAQWMRAEAFTHESRIRYTGMVEGFRYALAIVRAL